MTRRHRQPIAVLEELAVDPAVRGGSQRPRLAQFIWGLAVLQTVFKGVYRIKADAQWDAGETLRHFYIGLEKSFSSLEDSDIDYITYRLTPLLSAIVYPDPPTVRREFVEQFASLCYHQTELEAFIQKILKNDKEFSASTNTLLYGNRHDSHLANHNKPGIRGLNGIAKSEKTIHISQEELAAFRASILEGRDELREELTSKPSKVHSPEDRTALQDLLKGQRTRLTALELYRKERDDRQQSDGGGTDASP